MVEPSQELQLVFDKSIKDAQKLQHEYVTIEHLLFAMLCEENFINLMTMFGANVEYIKSNIEQHLKNNCDEIKTDQVKYKPKKTQTVERVLNRAFTQVLFAGRSHIQLSDILISMLTEKKSIAVYFLNKGNVTKENFSRFINEEAEAEESDIEEMSNEYKKALRAFTTNLKKARLILS
jgi:ATP-dependent Clp protease ATP-binding subunit ClpA